MKRKSHSPKKTLRSTKSKLRSPKKAKSQSRKKSKLRSHKKTLRPIKFGYRMNGKFDDNNERILNHIDNKDYIGSIKNIEDLCKLEKKIIASGAHGKVYNIYKRIIIKEIITSISVIGGNITTQEDIDSKFLSDLVEKNVSPHFPYFYGKFNCLQKTVIQKPKFQISLSSFDPSFRPLQSFDPSFDPSFRPLQSLVPKSSDPSSFRQLKDPEDEKTIEITIPTLSLIYELCDGTLYDIFNSFGIKNTKYTDSYDSIKNGIIQVKKSDKNSLYVLSSLQAQFLISKFTLSFFNIFLQDRKPENIMYISVDKNAYLYYKLSDDLSIYIKTFGKLLIHIDLDYIIKKIYNFNIKDKISNLLRDLSSIDTEDKIIIINPDLKDIKDMILFNNEPYTLIE